MYRQNISAAQYLSQFSVLSKQLYYIMNNMEQSEDIYILSGALGVGEAKAFLVHHHSFLPFKKAGWNLAETCCNEEFLDNHDLSGN